MSEFAAKIVDAILEDLRGRRGIKHELEAIDDDVKEEIRKEWELLIDGPELNDLEPFTKYARTEVNDNAVGTRISVSLGSYPGFRNVNFQIGPAKGYYGSDRLACLSKTQAKALAEWLLETVKNTPKGPVP